MRSHRAGECRRAFGGVAPDERRREEHRYRRAVTLARSVAPRSTSASPNLAKESPDRAGLELAPRDSGRLVGLHVRVAGSTPATRACSPSARCSTPARRVRTPGRASRSVVGSSPHRVGRAPRRRRARHVVDRSRDREFAVAARAGHIARGYRVEHRVSPALPVGSAQRATRVHRPRMLT